jgi:F0F1-type ATP synthase delta subunit
MILINPSALLLISEQAKSFSKENNGLPKLVSILRSQKDYKQLIRSCWLIGKEKGSTLSKAKSY